MQLRSLTGSRLWFAINSGRSFSLISLAVQSQAFPEMDLPVISTT